MQETIWDVAIIGSGPAGLTAGIYSVRGAASTIILGGDVWGGQLMLTSVVDNFPGFPEGIMGPLLMENMKSQAIRFGAEFVASNVTSVDFKVSPFVLKTVEKEIKAKTVIIATGAETKWLGVKGEKKLIGRGVSSCAPCDAPFFKEKYVLVIGGGDSAMEEALVLTKFAKKVTIIHRREEFKASKAMQEKVFANKNIDVIWNSEVTEVLGNQKFEAVKLKNNKTGTESELKADGVFVAIGHNPSSEIFKGLIDLDEKGYIVPKESSKTNIEGVFVSGDVHDHTYKQAITAAGFGCQAAMDALNFLDNNRS
jgi:thioredoxin reductase (NADPH)